MLATGTLQGSCLPRGQALGSLGAEPRSGQLTQGCTARPPLHQRPLVQAPGEQGDWPGGGGIISVLLSPGHACFTSVRSILGPAGGGPREELFPAGALAPRGPWAAKTSPVLLAESTNLLRLPERELTPAPTLLVAPFSYLTGEGRGNGGKLLPSGWPEVQPLKRPAKYLRACLLGPRRLG